MSEIITEPHTDATLEAIQVNATESTTRDELSPSALLESVLFVASGPVSLYRLARTLDTTEATVRSLLLSMEEEYERRGLRLQWSGNDVQLTTAPEASAVVEHFLGLEVSSRLSQAALEVLAIIAYMQPTTRPEVDDIRGVNSDAALRTLLSKGLIEEVGRMDTPGRPILYGTTPDFLQHFGLASLEELPPLAEEEEE
ncbi:MAG: SMC-Scp complex subunit ScpB [Candidatus Promineifilaceae bacterium]|nr:SMC-Scp complex subunit ScpB [Candidatus Promineifilaceae bacterium]